MHCFSLLFFSLFNVYELKYFVKYWKTGKPLRTVCRRRSKPVYKLFRSGGTAGNSWWGYFRPKTVIFHTRFQTWPLGRNYVIIT